MLKTIWAFLTFMQNQKKKNVFSPVQSFIDGFFIMVPFITAFKIVNGIPLFNPAALRVLDTCTMYRCIALMAAAVYAGIVLRYVYAPFPRRGGL